MRKYIRLLITFFLLMNLLFFGGMNKVWATNNVNTNESNQAQSNNDIENSDENNEEIVESHDDEVRSTTEPTSTATVLENDTTKKINSYSTVSTIPEANLGLNNILNVILIAIGIIMILLAIAILIRLKS